LQLLPGCCNLQLASFNFKVLTFNFYCSCDMGFAEM